MHTQSLRHALLDSDGVLLQGLTIGVITASTADVVDFYDRATGISEIAVLKGLPQLHLCSVLAHELSHAYMMIHGFPPDIDHTVCEGYDARQVACVGWGKPVCVCAITRVCSLVHENASERKGFCRRA